MQAEVSNELTDEERTLIMWALSETRGAEIVLGEEDPDGVLGEENRENARELGRIMAKLDEIWRAER